MCVCVSVYLSVRVFVCVCVCVFARGCVPAVSVCLCLSVSAECAGCANAAVRMCNEWFVVGRLGGCVGFCPFRENAHCQEQPISLHPHSGPMSKGGQAHAIKNSDKENLVTITTQVVVIYDNETRNVVVVVVVVVIMVADMVTANMRQNPKMQDALNSRDACCQLVWKHILSVACP